MSIEIWKDLKGYENIYQVSNLGRVKSLSRYVYNGKGYYLKKEKICCQRQNKKGYLMVDLVKHGNNISRPFLVHRLVAIAFIENIHSKPQINHIDGNKQNNNVENLEWCDNSQNQKHAYKLGLNKRSENAGREKRPVCLYNSNMDLIKEFNSIAETTRWLNCASSNVRLCCENKRKTVNGYIAKYKEKGVM